MRVLGRKRKEVQECIVQLQPFPLIFSKSSFFPLLSLVLRDRSTLINSTHLSKDDLHQSMCFPPIIPPRDSSSGQRDLDSGPLWGGTTSEASAEAMKPRHTFYCTKQMPNYYCCHSITTSLGNVNCVNFIPVYMQRWLKKARIAMWRAPSPHIQIYILIAIQPFILNLIYFTKCYFKMSTTLLLWGFLNTMIWIPFIHLFFYWRITALQNFVVFCQTSTWISHRYTYIPSLLLIFKAFVHIFI